MLIRCSPRVYAILSDMRIEPCREEELREKTHFVKEEFSETFKWSISYVLYLLYVRIASPKKKFVCLYARRLKTAMDIPIVHYYYISFASIKLRGCSSFEGRIVSKKFQKKYHFF